MLAVFSFLDATSCHLDNNKGMILFHSSDYLRSLLINIEKRGNGRLEDKKNVEGERRGHRMCSRNKKHQK